MDTFDTASKGWRADLIALLTRLQEGIDDEYRATDDPHDDTPAMAVTISTDDECSDWFFQTGDNSFSGACYCHPYWGIGSLSREDDPAEVADALLADLGDMWASGQD